ncbi:MAG: YkgJ family cysteine cluster protein [Candidatus Thiodiazotropha sp. (ex Lucinoma aequizonata)]|nr:YkgJ family cysteine cluster protein [Candidatus Thiodiazotropha sp. (ex Lucinoma aequizonata)]MCU7888529.1 YkgJ family cysteine cluster protein [Candidatus Thiodiazotropha sp. (ex Lucinoma aequizonata)]MCU7896720.1 YkgJ family cysteine cluster protein [Candidatus Thiodiazotropha sp. (ex Lucinoma aequizonata)]MCU7900104.1 YkgJ family cysteine cluster protein [Candidatus Thiodiazotropha sp. (ex Lucinoma aequizonata)]MCU7902452.1 YkgJ family cysteine cluster protein [Candidatus Thiodiazotropha
MSEKFDIPFKSSFVPAVLDPGAKLSFNCYKGISCFNACCKHADIQLTPYDILRLKDNLGSSATEFLKNHTVPYEMDKDGIPGVKLRTDNEGACLFVTDEGCSVYKDRPIACRYYPVGHMAMREAGASDDEARYFLVKEDHCKGHEEDQEIAVDAYRKEQEVEVYEQINREWLQLMLKKKSAGPTIGRPSDTSLQFFFMCSYDIDRLRRFVLNNSFKASYDLDEKFYETIEKEDLALMQFGTRLLKQVLFGDVTIPVKKHAVEQRVEERKEILELRKKAEIEIYKQKQEQQMKDALS